MSYKYKSAGVCALSALILFSLSGSSFAATAFFDNMENGPGTWNSSGFWHLKTNPQTICVIPSINPALVSLPGSGCLPAAYSGSSVWWYGEDSTGTYIGADYVPSAQQSKNGGFSRVSNRGTLISPVVNLTYASGATLSFRTWWEIESSDPTQADYMDVYLIPAVDPYYSTVHLGRLNPVIDTNGSHDIPYSSGGFNQQGVWVVQGYSLDDYVGYGYRLEFIFNTYDKNYNAFRGWLIDDVNVSFNEAYPVPLIYNVQPSSGGLDSAVYVYGTGFMSGAHVSVGGLLCSNVTVINDGLIVLSLPLALSSGMHNVTVTNPTNTSYTMANAFELISTATTTTTTTTSTTTTTTGSCILAGDNPPCGNITVPEILSAITLWAQGNMQIADVLNLITAWANG